MTSQAAAKIIPFQPPTHHEIPYSKEAEESLLGAVLINPSHFERCQDIIGSSKAFFFRTHATIWRAMETAYATNPTAVGDPVVLGETLKAMNKLDDIGGPAALTVLIRNTPTSTHATVYAGMVQRSHIKRQLLHQFETAMADATNGSLPTEILAEHLETMQGTINQLHTEPVDRAGLTDASAYHAMVSEAMRNPDAAKGIPTGFADLSDIVNGWHKSKLAVVGGLPFMGKTSTLLAFTLYAAMADYPVAYYNVADGTKQDVIGRMIAHLTTIHPINHGVPSIKQTTGAMTGAEFTAYMGALDTFTRLPIYITDQFGMSPREIALSARTLKEREGARLVVIDYYQRMGIEGDYPNRLKELEKISSLLVDMAKRLDLPVIVGAQVGHHIRDRKDKRPTLSDIKDCKAMAANADVVIFPHREAMFDDNCQFPNTVEFIVAKNKVSGRAGTASAYIDKLTGAIIPGVMRDGLTHEVIL